jgi:predicted Zn finger-like uncharacterized protein
MNLIARCPACHTSYRVVPDQLRISDGWVRCGQCGEIFDASQRLNESGTAQAATLFQEPADTPAQTDELLPQNAALLDQTRVRYESAAFNPGDAVVLGVENPNNHEALATRSASESLWESAVLLVKPSPESDAAEPMATGSESKIEPVSFMLAPAGSSGTLHRTRSMSWWGLGAALVLGLLAQGLHRERDQLAAFAPELKPVMQSVCDVLGCRVSPLQRIEDLVIDSAGFHQVGQDTFELRLVLKNMSRFELALPAIELTLTDMADQPVLRRIFTPVELGGATGGATGGAVAAAGDWSVSVYLRVSAEAAGVRALGYRLLAFYP